MQQMSEEIRYGAGGVPYVGGAIAPTSTETTSDARRLAVVGVSVEKEVVELELEEPAVKVTVTETETPGEITTAKKGRKRK